MVLKTSKTPAGANGGALGNVAHDQAINIPIITPTLAEVQAKFVASRYGVRPDYACLIAEIAFHSRRAA
jgi:hypothetical protein